MANEIEWATLPAPLDRTKMTLKVFDNSDRAASILAKGSFDVEVYWEVPAAYQCLLDGTFRIRLFAESLGNGPEGEICPQENVTALCGSGSGTPSYTHHFTVSSPPLLGEGEPDSDGKPVSGVYKITAVLQYQNAAGVDLPIGGYATTSVLQIRHP